MTDKNENNPKNLDNIIKILPISKKKLPEAGYWRLWRQIFLIGRIFSNLAEFFGENGRIPLENFGNTGVMLDINDCNFFWALWCKLCKS